ncbi:uncharacterized protein [Physcomitrium patens]|uniref:PHD-type domain-containing protein n=1 Tax=Physcomitrium patens TaxID=3218 RepID=A0A2K1IED4_PHYPA|nr:uncharacterized protein LOC112277365 [Physcomitrium patens]XP_024365327.1 uncharacterized protein LOC112277365 [Physcomitrium patens]XP_024365328.1 uncharacterized protein LOC112277365 [Physcomitrium patens]XP_024365329.1 uncharacterized protein LOC112277365 [Physcomitrium patens]XP_024365330.1 uncharacterized protein LOC112277365 [Physcomitrium patens]PNR27632.1 hypothetical protein PHYPA_029784 [Physcomitrium patens]|eukprot:XP_024365326.1 uncharacterized protein LOC112277365 [Physcomitrella patens]
MEISANISHRVADAVEDVGLSESCAVENGLLTATASALAGDRIMDPSDLHLDDESATVNAKKRAFDEGSKELRSPAKKLAVRGSPDVVVDSAPLDTTLVDAMLIDTDWGEPEGRCKVSDGQALPSSPKTISGSIAACTSVPTPAAEMGVIDDDGALRVCEAAEETPVLQNVVLILTSADSSVDTTKSGGDLATSNSVGLEVKGTGAMNEILVSHLPMQVENDVVKEEFPAILQNGHIDMGSEEQLISNVAAAEGTYIVINARESVSDTAADGGVLQSSSSWAGSDETKDGGHVALSSSALPDEVCASEARTTSMPLGPQTAQTYQGVGESVVADSAVQRETADEDANNDSGISEVDASKALEMKMVEVIMESLAFEVAGGRNDATSNPLSDDGLDECEQDGNGGTDLTNGIYVEEKCTELFEPVVQLPERSEGTNGFVGSAVGSEDPSSEPVSDNLPLQEGRDARGDSLRNRELGGSVELAVAPSKDLEFSQYSGSEKGGESMDRQDSDVATPSAGTSAQSRSPGLKPRLKLKGQGDVGMRQSPTLSGERGFMVKEVLLKEAPASAKLLLQSGLLDGHHVRYLGRGGHIMLTGIIQEGGVLCDCSSCKGVQVVNVSAFEKHAGSSARHPSDFIFLENGKCLKDILEIGWNANKQKMNVMDVLKSAIGEVGGEKVQIISLDHPLIAIQPAEKKLPQPRLVLDTKPRVPVDLKPRMPQVDMKPRVMLDTRSRMPLDTKAKSTSDVKARGGDVRATIPRLDRTTREKEAASPPVPSRESSGANLHKALFLPGGLEDDIEVGYYVKGQKFLAGLKRGAGILCSCCQQVISCSLFEQHAGWGSRRNPYTSIYLADGRSLHDAAQSLVVEQTVKQEGNTPAKIEHLDQCVECGDRGDLQLCTRCPNAYHQDCLGKVDSYSSGEFFCPDCQEQRYGGTKDRRRSMVNRRSKGAAKTLLSKDRVTGRCTRLLQVPEAVVLGGCVFCKSGDFAKTGFGPKTTLLCDQCEREYHVGCLKKHGLEDLKELPEGEWFCGQDCKHIHSILSLLVSNGPEPLADSIISKVLKTNQARLEGSEDATESSCSGFEWQLLHGRGGDPSNGKALAEVVQIFSECFDPIADGVSGGDLIPLMVYRRSIRDQDFGGIYCVVLKFDNKVVSTALIRVFGRQLAELPLLATNPSHQGQGHCKALLLSIERLLGVLRVERLALPAAEGAEGIWLNRFGFRRMAEEQVKQFHSDLNMMVFTGSSMLEKDIPPLEITGSRKS